MADSNVVVFNVDLPGKRRTHELVFKLGETVEEKHGCIKVKTATDNDGNDLNVWILMKSELDKHADAEHIRASLNNELGVLKLLDHRYVLKLFQVFASDDRTYVLTERSQQNLAKFVASKGGKLEPQCVCRLYNQLLSAISYVHSKGLTHRNINPASILVDDEGENIKLSEFGSACLQSSRQILSGTVPGVNNAYSAPEVIAGEEYHGKKADVWSAACVLYFMLSGKTPPATAEEAMADTSITAPVQDIFKNAMHPDWRNIDQQGRYGIEDIRSAPWVVTGRKHSSTTDVNPTVLDQALLRKSAQDASGVGFNRDDTTPAARGPKSNFTLDSGPPAIDTGEEVDSIEGGDGSLCDDSFSPLPKRGPRVFGEGLDFGMVEKDATIEPRDTCELFDLSPPASPSMKSRRALKLDTLSGEGCDGAALDAEFSASPMGERIGKRRGLPQMAMGSLPTQDVTEQHTENTQTVVTNAIQMAIKDNTGYMEETGLQPLLEDMLVYLLGSHPEGDEKISRLLEWARKEKSIRQEARQQGYDATRLSTGRRLSLLSPTHKGD